MNELLSDKPKEIMRMGQVWGNALRVESNEMAAFSEM